MRNKIYAALLAGSTLWCISILAAPLTGLPVVYHFFSIICHQDPARSWHIAGEPLPVCIRCASIYFGFLASLWLQISPRIQWLRASIAFMFLEFLLARLFVDSAALRCASGVFFGMAAAPFIRLGIEEMVARRQLQGANSGSM